LSPTPDTKTKAMVCSAGSGPALWIVSRTGSGLDRDVRGRCDGGLQCCQAGELHRWTRSCSPGCIRSPASGVPDRHRRYRRPEVGGGVTNIWMPDQMCW
jgi:hypothetical protein